MMKIGSDDFFLKFLILLFLGMRFSVFFKNVFVEMLKNYGYDRCRRNFFWELYCIRGKVVDIFV